jgi:hypothetical protein
MNFSKDMKMSSKPNQSYSSTVISSEKNSPATTYDEGVVAGFCDEEDGKLGLIEMTVPDKPNSSKQQYRAVKRNSD